MVKMPAVQVSHFPHEWCGNDLTVMVECSTETGFDLSRLLRQEATDLAPFDQQQVRVLNLRSLERRLNKSLLAA
jgi:hypothetical protein